VCGHHVSGDGSDKSITRLQMLPPVGCTGLMHSHFGTFLTRRLVCTTAHFSLPCEAAAGRIPRTAPALARRSSIIMGPHAAAGRSLACLSTMPQGVDGGVRPCTGSGAHPASRAAQHIYTGLLQQHQEAPSISTTPRMGTNPRSRRNSQACEGVVWDTQEWWGCTRAVSALSYCLVLRLHSTGRVKDPLQV
jgi:hypothetical protein